MSITKEDFDTIINDTAIAGFSAADFQDKSDRTLLFGYTLLRETFHVYMKDGEINLYIYDTDMVDTYHEFGVFDCIDDLIPCKRSYPESTDPEFLLILKKNNISGNFTTYDEKRYEKIKNKLFHGLTC